MARRNAARTRSRSAGGFRRVAPDVDFAALEERVLDLWERLDAFATSVAMRPADDEYTFYDGPPFPTGTPHYGNLLAGVIKDIVPRYWTMRGHRVERRFGWDTHGLPIEMEAEKQLGLSGPRQVEEYGVDRFNEACRALVETNTEQWEHITRRIGRWVDFRNDYKTMDLEFMESVWWAFKQLWDKGLIYQDFKVLPYSWGAHTPLSNFEANLDYRQIDDPSVTVRLRVTEGSGPLRVGDWLLIWTTTPWTLPGNLVIAVGEQIPYACVEHEGEQYWIAEGLIDRVWRDGAKVVATALGSELVGAGYEPPFDYFGEERDRGAFRVIASEDVTTDEGTGLVHMAPAYGEADFFALQGAGLDVLVDPVDAEARFTEAAPDVAGMYVKDADAKLIDMLKSQGSLVRREQIRHSYPFCYRTGTPLIYKAIPTWFVRVESVRDRMVDLNKRIHWVPEHVGSRRFGNWLESARDWAISRNRYWGSCIPVWTCEACEQRICVGSVAELEEYSGERLTDLHKHVVDRVTFPCPDCGATMSRVPEVLDVWFESGSMPYAQLHYPFENAAGFAGKFPADFIAEGLDQTRGWFYTLVVLATAIFDEVPFRNCVVNGLILAEDGRKMSKSLKNYPDPDELLSRFGADALRAYMINSPVLRAEPFRFSEDGIREVVRTVLLPLWNAFSFFTTYAEADGITMDDLSAAPPPDERPELDRWILSVLQSLIAETNRLMEGYYLYAVIPPTLGFIDDLTNWYIRRSRRRFWRSRSNDDADKAAGFATLYEVLITFSKVLAPVLPFITEEIYQQLVVAHDGREQPASVHHCDFPAGEDRLIHPDVEAAMSVVRRVSRLGHALRKQHQLKVRQPLAAVTVVSRDPEVLAAVDAHLDLIAEELNVKRVVSDADEVALVELSAKADFKVLGPRLGGRVKEMAREIEHLDADDIHALQDGATLQVAGEPLTIDDVLVQRVPKPGMVVAAEGDLSVAIDTDLTPELEREGLAREIINRVQQLRRERQLVVTDRIRLRWGSDTRDVVETFAVYGQLIAGEVLAAEVVRMEPVPPGASPMEINGHPLLLDVEPASAPRGGA